jgi:putative DNA primase/helicase
MNGKSKFLELLRKFIGGENCCTTELDTLLVSRFEITRLHKKLVCMMGETNFNEMSKTSILKKLTGGDTVGFEYKNKNPFDEVNYAKILIATNNLPSTTDKTDGFYRRWMIIDFPNRFSEKKDILAEIPEEEYNALALKCCFILKEVINARAFTNEGSIEDRMNKYEAKSNFLEKFIKEMTEENLNGYITKADFYKRFCEWSKEHKHRDMSEMSVAMTMKKMNIESEKKYFQWLFDGKGGQLRVWTGISWKS